MSDSVFTVFPSENFVDLCMYQFGREQCPPAYSFGPATRNHYLFHYVLSGTGRLMTTNTKGEPCQYQIRTGEGFMIFPRQITTYIADEKLPWEYVWIEFDGVYAASIVEKAGLSIASPVFRPSDRAAAAEMMETMMDMARDSDRTSFYKISKLYNFADCLIRSAGKPYEALHSDGSLSDYYLQTAFLYIEKNFMNDISVESIARRCNIHRNQLLKLFKERINQGPQEYLIKYRMSKAAQLLLTTQLSVGEIANAVGYSNQLHFSRAFKNVYGRSPKYFREEKKI